MSFPFEYRGRIKLDANRITDSGFYYADGQSSNVDNHIGPFLNFKADQNRIEYEFNFFFFYEKFFIRYLSLIII